MVWGADAGLDIEGRQGVFLMDMGMHFLGASFLDLRYFLVD